LQAQLNDFGNWDFVIETSVPSYCIVGTINSTQEGLDRVTLLSSNNTCDFTTAPQYCLQSYVFTKMGCSFGGDYLTLSVSAQCYDTLFAGLLTVSLLQETCPSVDVSISGQDPNFQSYLTFYGTDSTWTTTQPGYVFNDPTTGVVFYYSFFVNTPSGLSISSYQIVSATLGSVSILGTTSNANGQFSTALVSANNLGLASGSYVLTLNVTVSVTYSKRGLFGGQEKRALLSVSTGTSANQKIFFTVPNQVTLDPHVSHATWPIASFLVWVPTLYFLMF